MSIFIRPCGHSGQTEAQNSDICPSCAHIAKHGPAKKLYSHNADSQKVAKARERMKSYWATRKANKDQIDINSTTKGA